jgi:ADP-heptose:LPS heptosyltransferase
MKVLVIRLSALGDITHASSVIEPLAKAGCEIHFVTKSSFASIFQDHPQLKSIYSYDSAKKGERSAREHFLTWVEQAKFDFILDLHDSLRTRLWRRRLRSSAKVYVAKKERWREFAILFLRQKKSLGFGAGGRALKMRTLALAALSEHGKTVDAQSMPLTSLTISSNLVSDWKAKLPSRFAVLLPGSAWPGKQWPYFPDLAESLARELAVIVLGGEKDSECDAAAARAMKENAESRSLRAKTSLRDSMAILALAERIYGNDTGMVHVAEALGKDVTVIEGPTEKSLGFSPYRPGSKIAGLSLFCRPCSKTGKYCLRFGSRICLNGISPKDVQSL